MSDNIPPPSEFRRPFLHRNDSGELDVFEAARYFAGAPENIIGTYKNISGETRNFIEDTRCMRPTRRMSLDMPNNKGNNSIPLESMLIEDPMMIINKEKKSKQPNSPGGKLAHFLISLFNQTSSKKSNLKTKSTKDVDESPSGWRRKRRSSMSNFWSGNSNSTPTTIMSDSRSPFSTSKSSGFKTPPPYHIAHTPTKNTSYRDPKSYSYLKPHPSQITKIPINANLNKIENFNKKIDFIEKKMDLGNGFVEKVKIFDGKQEEHHPHKYIFKENIKEFKKFINEDDGDSDSSSDLFELTNCDIGYYSSGNLSVYETTHVDSINRGAPISS